LTLAKRVVLVAGTFSLSLLLYIDRVCISAAKDPIASDLELNDTQMGWVLSAFALGYALFQTPSGLLADRFGPRRVLTAVVAFWSLFTGLTGAAVNFFTLFLYRLVFGVGEAGAFPGIARATFSWIPMRERGLVTGINFSGSRLGAAFALPAVAWMVGAFGWRTSFYFLAAVGFVWAVFWYVWFRDDPAQHRRISQRELEYILSHRQKAEEAPGHRISLRRLFGSGNMALAMTQYFCSNFTFFFCLTWLFPHVKSTYELGTVRAALYAAAPLLFGALGNWFSGALVDRIYHGGRWVRSRRIPAILGFFLASAGLIGSAHMSSAFPAILFLSVAIFGADMTLSPSWSFCVDIGRKNAGAVSGTMNMAGNIGAFITALAFPYLKAWTGSVMPFFYLGAGLNALAVIVWMRMRPDRPLEVSV